MPRQHRKILSRWRHVFHRSALPVNFAPVANGCDLDGFARIVNQVQHPVITDPNPVAIVAVQLLDSGWARVILEFEQLGDNAAVQCFR